MVAIVLLGLGCSSPEPAPPDPADSSSAPVLDLREPALWSFPGDQRPQHHATVAVGHDGIVVSWTLGAIGGRPESYVTVREGPVSTVYRLHGTGLASMPDVEIDPEGRAAVLFHTPDEGVWLDRTADFATGESAVMGGPESAGGKGSPDLAVAWDGTLLGVWYGVDGDAGVFHGAALSPDLAPVSGRLIPDFGAGEFESDLGPDVAAAPDGGCVVAWLENSASITGTGALWLTRLGSGGEVLGEWEVDRAAAEAPPRRPTVVVDAAGRVGVVWRRRTHEDWATSEAWYAAYAQDGTVLAAPARVLSVYADDPVIALVDDTWLLLAFATFGDRWAIELAPLSFPEGIELAEPIPLSDSQDPHRPHVAVGLLDGGWTAAVSWEEPDAAGQKVVMGRRIDLE